MYVNYSVISWSAATRHKTPRSMRHFPLIGSAGDRLMYGASSRNEIFKWNFSGTPCGGACEFPGHTISRISSFCAAQDFQTPIWEIRKDTRYTYKIYPSSQIITTCDPHTSSHTRFLLFRLGLKFMIFSSADFRSPSAVNSIFGLLMSVSKETFRRCLKNLCMQKRKAVVFIGSFGISMNFSIITLLRCPIVIFLLPHNSSAVCLGFSPRSLGPT